MEIPDIILTEMSLEDEPVSILPQAKHDLLSVVSGGKSDKEYSFYSTGCVEKVKMQSIDGLEDLVEPSNMHLWRSYTEEGATVLGQVDGKDVLLVVGKTDTGDSLLIKSIFGKKFTSTVYETISDFGEKVSRRVFEAEDPFKVMKLAKLTKTRAINFFVRHDAGRNKKEVVHADLPGSEDTGAPEVDIAKAVMLNEASKPTRNLQFMVLINYALLLEDPGGAMFF